MANLKRTVLDLDTDSLDSRWLIDDKTEEDKEKTREVLRNSTIQFRALKRILQEEFDSKQLKPVDFDNPNFDQKRIYMEGYLRALQNIYKLLP
jgi:hypothetical protein